MSLLQRVTSFVALFLAALCLKQIYQSLPENLSKDYQNIIPVRLADDRQPHGWRDWRLHVLDPHFFQERNCYFEAPRGVGGPGNSQVLIHLSRYMVSSFQGCYYCMAQDDEPDWLHTFGLFPHVYDQVCNRSVEQQYFKYPHHLHHNLSLPCMQLGFMHKFDCFRYFFLNTMLRKPATTHILKKHSVWLHLRPFRTIRDERAYWQKEEDVRNWTAYIKHIMFVHWGATLYLSSDGKEIRTFFKTSLGGLPWPVIFADDLFDISHNFTQQAAFFNELTKTQTPVYGSLDSNVETVLALHSPYRPQLQTLQGIFWNADHGCRNFRFCVVHKGIYPPEWGPHNHSDP